MKKPDYEFKNSIEYIFTNMSEGARKRRDELKLKRIDIDEDVGMVSCLMNNKRNSRHPNLITNQKGKEIAEKLNYSNLDELLWGQINWNELLEIILVDVATSPNSPEIENNLKSKLFIILREYVPFACELALSEFNMQDLSDAKIKEAIKWVLNIGHLFDRETSWDEVFDPKTAESIGERLKNRFMDRFFVKDLDISYATEEKKGIDMFSKRFPVFLMNFLNEEFDNIKTAELSIGKQAYGFAKSALDTKEDLIIAYHNSFTNESKLKKAIINDDDLALLRFTEIADKMIHYFNELQKTLYANKKANQ
ncbi:hypothetical protein AKUH3B203J_11830 [Apilactobacillus kunkeei]|nr:hypothetical protein AKUH3B203J_11830 [Apilactobacillus kunkeei]